MFIHYQTYSLIGKNNFFGKTSSTKPQEPMLHDSIDHLTIPLEKICDSVPPTKLAPIPITANPTYALAALQSTPPIKSHHPAALAVLAQQWNTHSSDDINSF
jgi:hypothetical protein